MAFDADAFRAARRPWTLRIGGQTYTARPISVQAILAFKSAADAAGTDEAAAAVATRALLRQMFPYRLHYRWRGDPVDQLLSDPAIVHGALTDFFEYLAGTMGAPVTTGIASSA